MDRRQLAITATAVGLALVLGAGVALLATSGADEPTGSVSSPTGAPGISSTTSTSVASTTTTRSPIVTVPTLSPGTIVIIPPTTTTTRPKRTPRTQPTTTTTTPPATVAPAATTSPTTAPPETSTTTAPTPTVTEPTVTSTTTTTSPAPTTEIGVTKRRIRLAVIADDVDVLAGARAWSEVVNRRGGIGGRKLRLDLLATGGTADGYANAVATACSRDLAIVAGLSSLAADPAPLDCGIPDIAIETLTEAHTQHDTTYAAFPRRAGTEAVGPYRYLQTAVEDCCSQFVLVPDREPGRAATAAAIAAATEIGFDAVATPDVAVDAPESDYDALAQDLLAADATFVSSGLGRDSTIELRRASDDAGVTGVEVWFCDARCYEPTFLTEGSVAVDDQYVAIETVPFTDRRKVPEMRSYLKATARNGETADYDALRAYVTGLLAEQALRAVIDAHGDDGITRAGLLDALAAIHDFTGAGLVGPTDVGGRAPNGCAVVLQVRDGEFTRVHPAERGSLDCGPQNLVELGD